jgi:hypothetical protein
MQIPRLRFSASWVIVAVAIAALLVLAESLIAHTRQEVYLPVSSIVAGVFALGAMRQPRFFLAIAVMVWVALPRTFDSSSHDMFEGAYQLGWILGAIAGKVMRSIKREGDDVP